MISNTLSTKIKKKKKKYNIKMKKEIIFLCVHSLFQPRNKILRFSFYDNKVPLENNENMNRFRK